MRRADAPVTRDILLIGGGHAHALLLRRWAMAPLPGARLTLVNPDPTAPYTGMLPGLVAGHYREADLEIDLVRLARFAGARLILDRIEGLDTEARLALPAGRPPIAYDVASINIGVTAEIRGLPGMAEHGVPAKPLGRFAEAWRGFVARVAGGAEPSAAVIGAGVGGVELAMAMAHQLRAVADPSRVRVALIEAAPRILPAAAPAAARILRRRLAASGVEIVEAAPAAALDAEGVDLADGRRVPARFIATAAGARPQPWLETTGLPLQDGFLRVDRHLRAIGDPNIFAAGDCAHLDEAPRDKAGVYAVRQAPILAENLARAVSDRPLRAYRPQGDYLKLITTGAQAAVAEKWGLALWSPWFWRWKNRIDRVFMERLTDLPPPEPEAAPTGPEAIGVRALREADPLCGGCGSKVGPGALAAGLSDLGAGPRDDVERAPGDDAAILRVGETRLAFTTDQFRAFIEDPYELGRIAALHAMGDVWAMGGRPQAALATVILPPMSPDKQAVTLREILAGAEAALGPAGAALAGGHTASGAELSVGFAVTGHVARPLGLDGARPGDALILTKPIGLGVLLAAEMRGLAPGRDWAAALDVMRQPNGPAAEILARDARAMTDVTGFGLAGHLLNLLRASGAAAEIGLDNIPLTLGAERLAAAGVRSALATATEADAAPDLAPDDLADDPRRALLFDPQTAGGLLAALPPEAARPALAALAEAGLQGWRVGRLLEAAPGAPRLRILARYRPGAAADPRGPDPESASEIASAAAS